MNSRLFACCAAFCLMVATLFADGAADVRRHMEQRLPMIDGLKARQIIGENNRGYVETRQPGTAQDSAILADENRDRETVYALIAQQTGQSADAVGRARAKKISANSSPGVWVQNEAGQWHRK